MLVHGGSSGDWSMDSKILKSEGHSENIMNYEYHNHIIRRNLTIFDSVIQKRHVMPIGVASSVAWSMNDVIPRSEGYSED